MSLLDQASLVLVPSAIKTGEVLVQKPLPTKFSDETGNYDGNDPQGSANLTFTRNSNATRVNSSGLVEKVRTNLLLQSNSFDTTWATTTAIVTSGQSGYNGTSNAWKLERVGAAGLAYIYQIVNVTGIHSYSVYAKANTNDWIFIQDTASGGANGYFDLANGVAGTVTALSHSITSVGDGWYRITVVGNRTTNDYIRIFVASGNGSLTVNGSIFIQNAQFELSDFGPTDYIATTSAAVSVGPTANVPRLDYSGGATCGKLLLEPQRTNLLYASEDLTATYWNKYGGQTITGNDAISPDGYQNADKMVDAGGIYQQRAFSASTAYALSVFIKKDTATSFRLGFVDYQSAGYFGGDIRYTFATGAITVTQSLNSSVSGEAVDYGNGWIRLICKFTTNASQNYNYQFAEYDGGTGWSWGYQLEAGSYATSYIPTLGASVTRLADSASRTNIANLIGQTEGTLFCDFNVLPSTLAGSYYLETILNDGTASNKISITYYASGRIQFVAFASGSLVVNIDLPSYGLTVGKHKFALAYKLNDYVAYVDGALVGSDTSAAVPAMSALNLYDTNGGTHAVNQTLLFKTRLSNATLANLTAL